MSVSTNTWDSLTNVRNPLIKMLLLWEMALTVRNRAQMQSAFRTQVWSGAQRQYFIHPASPLSCQDVTMAVLTGCLSRKLWKLIFIVNHIRAIDRQWVRRVLQLLNVIYQVQSADVVIFMATNKDNTNHRVSLRGQLMTADADVHQQKLVCHSWMLFKCIHFIFGGIKMKGVQVCGI